LEQGAVKCRFCAEFVIADPRLSEEQLRETLRRFREAGTRVEEELERRREEELKRRKEESDRATPEVPVRVGMSLDEAERLLVLATLKAMEGNRTRAARTLGIGERTLYRRLDEWAQGDAST